MPSCTTPIFSKIEVTFCATQPATFEICQVSGTAIATSPTESAPMLQSQSAIAAVPTTIAALSTARVRPKPVMKRSWARNVSVCVVHRFAHELVLVARLGEELHRQDVGVAVDDAAGQRRAHFRHRLRRRRTRGTKYAAGHGIGEEPQRHRNRQPRIARRQQHERDRAVDQDVPDRVDARDHAFPQRRAGLHHAVGDAAGEIVLEEAPALAHDMPVTLPAHHVGEAGIDRLVGDHVLDGFEAAA